eukprot:767697-Hanusia_phi.AAC.3
MAGTCESHSLGEGSVGVGKFTSKESRSGRLTLSSRLLVLYTGGTMGMKPNAENALAPVVTCVDTPVVAPVAAPAVAAVLALMAASGAADGEFRCLAT